MNLIPVGKRLLVKMCDPEGETPGGILLHNTESFKAEVIDMGPGAIEELGVEGRHGITTGDTVFLPRGKKSGEAFPDGDDLYLLIPTTMVGGKFAS